MSGKRGGQGKGRQRSPKVGRGAGSKGQRAQQPRRGGPPRSGGNHSQDREAGRPRGRQRDPDDLGGDRVEGRNAVVEALRVGRRNVRELFVADDIEESAIIAEILDLASDDRVPVNRVNRRKLDDMARTESPQGVIAEARPIKPVDLELLTRPQDGRTPFLVVLDGITDPGNLGAVLRTAEVAGATGIVIPRHRAARLTPAAVKAAAGAVEHLRIALVGGLPTAISTLAEHDVWSVGLTAEAPRSLWQTTAALDGPIAIVLGAEGAGLGRLVSERCDELVSIPQFGQLDSLNVSNAAAVACYEVVRRRV
ncbi:MAG: 23S rRNA (guanosine(2251)-2'-O)-methyltransferase RlmB [Actinomycetia bacterium]|nr:23S rRNA (guanosine(2251)-2'-O)-methyltransferase RlmB [Actinomycetes bacterium]MCP4961862.1 23S rRNA (guanosine(2251)-2'-O)-methyltransferase RlmB [Actinomycetes bacterium]